MAVRPKKHLGQHFLKNEMICADIAAAITLHEGYSRVLEVGPGTGALTKHLLARKDFHLAVVEVDTESIGFLNQHYGELDGKIIEEDFLKLNLAELSDEQLGVVGNFPYNISSQILFKVLDFKELVPEVVGMFQKEVAERIASPAGPKEYGVISVLLQAYYNIEYLFTVGAHEFEPPPKVQSAVIRLTRKSDQELGCDPKLFKQVVKMSFGQRRKTMRNSLKSMIIEKEVDKELPVFSQRPEQLSVEEFVALTKLFSK